MLNQLVRYAPVVSLLRGETGTIAEIGSGSVGISQYLDRPVIGVEIRFLETPGRLVVPVCATATALPFRDASVDVLLIMDTMEHIPPSLRTQALSEATRVARKRIIVGGPMGPRAREADVRLAKSYRARGHPLPDWLQEHLDERAPDVADIVNPLRRAGWSVRATGNENLHAHVALMRAEMRSFWFRAFGRVRRHAPQVAQGAARAMRLPPYYSYLVDARLESASSQDAAMRSTSGPQS